MATLTSTGINCSDGTLDGQYTGTNANYTSYPIGSYLFMGLISGDPAPNNNASTAVRTSTSYFSSNSGTLLSGTWRNRGQSARYYNCAYMTLGYLMQRTA